MLEAYTLLGIGYATAACLYLWTIVEQPAWRWVAGWLYIATLWPPMLAMTVVGLVMLRRRDRRIRRATDVA